MNVSEFFEKTDIPSLILGAFFGRYEFKGDYIYTYSTYKNGSIYDNKQLCEQSKIEYKAQLNKLSAPYSNWILNKENGLKFPRTNVVYYLYNDMGLTKIQFFNKLYSKVLLSDFINEPDLSENKKMFIRGMLELRGSIDRNRSLLANDYVYNSLFEIKRIHVLTDFLDVPTSIFNYNFRDLQNEYLQGIYRDTQLRPNLNWYASTIGFINNYKSAVYQNNFPYAKVTKGEIKYFKAPTPSPSDNDLLNDRIKFYYNFIFGKKLSEMQINSLRKKIGFDLEEIKTSMRNQSLVNIVRHETEDKCFACCDKYDIKDRSYINKKTQRYAFQIHHVISLGGNKELDIYDNMVKLCPICHSSIKRGAAEESEQKKIIESIFNNAPNVYEFAKSFFNSDDKRLVINEVWKSLK